MSIFDRILKRGISDPEKTTRPGDPLPSWMAEFEQDRAKCDLRVSPDASGTPGDQVAATLLPILSAQTEQFQRWCGSVWNGLAMSTIPDGGAFGLLWCKPCAHGTIHISPPKEGHMAQCSSCGSESPVRYIQYSPRVGKVIHDLFSRHWECCELMAQARASIDNRVEAILLYERAEAICREIGNQAVLADVLRLVGKLREMVNRNTAPGLAALEEAVRLSESLDEPMFLAECLVDLAEARRPRGDPGVAMVLQSQAIDACSLRQPRGRDWFVLNKISEGRAILSATRCGWVSEALGHAKEADRCMEQLYAELPELARKIAPDTKSATDLIGKLVKQYGEGPQQMGELAKRAIKRDDRQAALDILTEARSILRNMEDEEGLLAFSNGQLLTLFEAGGLGDALASSEEAEQLAKNLEHLPSLSAALHHQGQLLAVLDRPDEATAKNKELAQVNRRLEELKGQAPDLELRFTQAVKDEEFVEALALSNELIESLRQQGMRLELATALYRHAVLEGELGDRTASLRSLERLEAIGYLDPRFQSAIPEGLYLQAVQLSALGQNWLALVRLRRSADGYLQTAKPLAGNPQFESVYVQAVDRLILALEGMRALGDGFILAGGLTRATEAYRGVVALEKSALEMAPNHSGLRFRQVSDVDELGVTLMKGNAQQRAEGEALIRDAVRLLEQLDTDDSAGVEARAAARSELQQHLALTNRSAK